jgi:hypothetical protein
MQIGKVVWFFSDTGTQAEWSETLFNSKLDIPGLMAIGLRYAQMRVPMLAIGQKVARMRVTIQSSQGPGTLASRTVEFGDTLVNNVLGSKSLVSDNSADQPSLAILLEFISIG